MKFRLTILAVAFSAALFFGCSRGDEPPILTLIQLMQEGKHDEVIALGEKLIEENPDNTQAHRFLLRSASEKDEIEKYSKVYEDRTKAHPEVAGYHFGLGYALLRLENADMDAALVELKKAVELNPDLEYVHYTIGWIYFDQRYSGTDHEKALAEWKKEELLSPRSLGALQVYTDRAEYYLANGNPDGAIKDYEKITMYGFARYDIKDAREWITRIRALGDELARLEVEARNNPGNVDVLIELGKVQYNNAMIEAAVETWEEAIEAQSENAEIRNYLGKGLIRVGRTDEAMEHLHKAIELDPTFAMAYYNLAVVEDALGKTDDAIEHYDKYIEFNPMTTRLEQVKQRIAELKEGAAPKEEG